MAVELDEARRSHLVQRLQGFWMESFDAELSAFRAEEVLDFFLEALAPPVYNQAVQDARRFMLKKLEDLEGDVHAPEILP